MYNFNYDSPEYTSPLPKGSGKGDGARDSKMRHQDILVFPAWISGPNSRSDRNKTGADKRINIGIDVYCSSRWNSTGQVYDHYHSPKTVSNWWETAPWEWVFIQEVTFSFSKKDFDWSNCKSLPSNAALNETRHKQWLAYKAAYEEWQAYEEQTYETGQETSKSKLKKSKKKSKSKSQK